MRERKTEQTIKISIQGFETPDQCKKVNRANVKRDWPFLMTISNDQLWKLGGIKKNFKLIILFTGYCYRFLASTINSVLLLKNLEFGKLPPSISPAKFSLSFKEQSK